MEINGIGVNIPNPAKTDYGKATTPPATMDFRCSTRPHGRIGVVVCFDRHYPESIRSTVGAITEYSAEAASTTLRHLLSTVRQVELPDQYSRWPPRNTWGSTTWTAARPLTALPPSWASVRCSSAAFSVRSMERGSRSISAAFASKKQSSCRKKQPARSNGLCRPLCSLRLQIAVNCDKVSL